MTPTQEQERAVHILASTNDGDDLTDIELKVVEWAVNGFLSEVGKEKLNEMHLRCCQFCEGK